MTSRTYDEKDAGVDCHDRCDQVGYGLEKCYHVVRLGSAQPSKDHKSNQVEGDTQKTH